MLRQSLTVLMLALAWGAPLASASTTVTLRGHAYYGGGPRGTGLFPARNLRVTVKAHGHTIASAETNSKGIFVFRLRPGFYQLKGHPVGSPTYPAGWCARTVRLRRKSTTTARLICGAP